MLRTSNKQNSRFKPIPGQQWRLWPQGLEKIMSHNQWIKTRIQILRVTLRSKKYYNSRKPTKPAGGRLWQTSDSRDSVT